MSRRLPQIAFAMLVLATIGAFFLVQALKTRSPLLWTLPTPIPAAFNPIHGRSCLNHKDRLLNYRQTQVTFSVTHSDTVGVYVVSQENPNGNTIATVSAGTPMTAAPNASVDTKTFIWNGRLDDGQFAPDGVYYFRIVLEKEDRSINLSPEVGAKPVQVLTQPPDVKVLNVRLLGTRPASGTTTTTTTGTTTVSNTTSTGSTTATSGATTGSSQRAATLHGPAVISPPHGTVRITFTRGKYKSAAVDIYRTDVNGGPELVDSFPITDLKRNWIDWNGRIGKTTPASAGTYLIGISAEDLACNKARWPAIPVVAGTTSHAGVTVRYLSVTPPLTPTASGGRAAVVVASASGRFQWQLRRSGRPKAVEHGSGAAGRTVIHVRMPAHQPGLYALTVRAGTQSAAVPLVASQAGRAAAHTRVLVVLPMLDWMGNSPVDDTGDGLPDTLSGGDPVPLSRPLVDGLPDNFGADATLLAYLTSHRLSFQLTTDVALAEGTGPSLADRGGVVFPGGEDILPAGLDSTLRGFVRAGGRALVLGTHGFAAVSHISHFPAAPQAGVPRPTATDPFGARRGPVTPTGGELISANGDDFALFNDAGEFSGFNQYQPIVPPAGATKGAISVAGIGSGAPAIVAFRDRGGTVVEVGLSGFSASLSSNADVQHLLANAWELLSR